MKDSMLDDVRLASIGDAITYVNEHHVPGALVEFGCRAGGTAKWMSLRAPGRRVFVFDTFTGLPTPSSPDHDADLRFGEFACALPDAARTFEGLPITIVVGRFPLSAEGISPTIAVAHLDFDLYEPTLDALRYTWPLLAVGGAIILDDYRNTRTPGILQALEQFAEPWVALGNMQASLRKSL